MNIGVRITTAVVTVSLLGIYAASSAPAPMLEPGAWPHVESAPPFRTGPAVPELEDPVDLNGNEVTPAIAKYKVDGSGQVYEEHSPETELPRLAIPKS